MTSQNVTLPDGLNGAMAEVRYQLQRTWLRLPLGLRTRVWPGIIAALAVLALLLAFHQVVSAAVRQAASRRAVATAHAEATWRCNALGGQGLRAGCLAQLDATPRDGAARPVGSAGTLAAVALIDR